MPPQLEPSVPIQHHAASCGDWPDSVACPVSVCPCALMSAQAEDNTHDPELGRPVQPWKAVQVEVVRDALLRYGVDRMDKVVALVRRLAGDCGVTSTYLHVSKHNRACSSHHDCFLYVVAQVVKCFLMTHLWMACRLCVDSVTTQAYIRTPMLADVHLCPNQPSM